jgi:class 3 adenylate cyclase/pimeloyl-ACP methyl ester carboxylesterase
MEPHIRYVRSADGTKIATATLGSGPYLVAIPAIPLASIEGGRAIQPERTAIERLAERHTVVQFDPRGQGLSDRDIADLSLEARVADIEAVFATVPGPASVFSRAWQAPASIAFAARYPERVRRLVLTSAAARGQDYVLSDKRRALAAVLDVDWELYCSALAFVEFGWTEEGRQYADIISKSVTADVVRRNWRAMRQHDASEYLSSVRCPTLLLYTPQPEVGVRDDAARSLATLIPGARLQPFDGPFTQLGLSVRTVDTVLDFFEEDVSLAASTEPPQVPGTAIILFLDIAGSTELTTRLGDAAYREQERALDASLRAAIREAGGKPVEGKVLGDGVMATFASAKDAIDAALRCQALGGEAGLSLHAGIHAGDVLREGQNVHGGAVQVAARIADASAAGEVLVSDIVRGLARTSAGVAFEDRGERELKGVSEPVRVFAVRAALRSA